MGQKKLRLSLRKYTKCTYVYQVNHKGDFPKLFDLLQDFLINVRHQTVCPSVNELLSTFHVTFTRK